MTKHIEYLKDIANNNYLGIKIYDTEVYPYINQLKDLIGEEQGNIYLKNQQNRDFNKYHITLINVMEYNKLMKEMNIDKFVNSLNSLFEQPIDDIKFMGLGTAERNENKAYFVVIKSEKLQEVRKAYGLDPKDLHITIGFLHRDVFGVPKNKIIEKSNKFLKLLSKEYYNDNETFEFIKSISNFEWNRDDDIEPIKINDNWAIFRNGKNRYVSIALIDDLLKVSGSWENNEKIPIISNTLILRKFKEIE